MTSAGILFKILGPLHDLILALTILHDRHSLLRAKNEFSRKMEWQPFIAAIRGIKQMAKQMPREDLFTPIHKGIRSMIYVLGATLQRTDFTDLPATESIVSQLKQNLQSANSTCILCMLHEHGGHEDERIFPQIAKHDSLPVEKMIQEHVEITKQIVEISKVADKLVILTDSDERMATGNRLNRMVNNLLAYYLIHLNNEEETILPLTWKYLTDDEIREIRTKIQMSVPPEKYAQWMQWILPSLNIHELAGMFSGMKKTAPPQVVEKMAHLAEQSLDKETWRMVKEKVGL